MALCMCQGLERACCTVASLCSGPETGLARWVRIKKQWEKLILFFIGDLSVSSAGLSSRLSSKCRLRSFVKSTELSGILGLKINIIIIIIILL